MILDGGLERVAGESADIGEAGDLLSQGICGGGIVGELFELFGFAGDVVETVGTSSAGEPVGDGGEFGHIPEIESGGHGCEGGDGAVAEFFGEGQEDGVAEQLGGDGGGVVGLRGRVRGELADHAKKFGDIDRLGGEFIAAGAEAALAVFHHGVGGERDDGPFVTIAAEIPGGGVAVHDGHLHIHEDDVEGFPLGKRGEGLIVSGFTVFSGGDGAAGALKVEGDDITILSAIFGEKNTRVELRDRGHRVFGGGHDAMNFTRGEECGIWDNGNGKCNPESASAMEFTLDGEITSHDLCETSGD